VNPGATVAPEIRFWRFVSTGDGCWEWTGGRAGQRGYGAFGLTRDRMVYAHRFSWIMHFGPIPEGLFVCHRCDNPPCVRPDHLFLGSHRDNMADMVGKRRYPLTRPATRGERNGQHRLTEVQVRAIRASGDSNAHLARAYGVSETLIRAVRARRAWGWLANA
jgi:hypothetical protein